MTILIDFFMRFLPSTLLIFLFIEFSLSAKYNKYLQIIIGSTAYYFSGILGQYLRENYNLNSIDLLLMFIILTCYSIFFHKDRLRFKIFIPILTLLIVLTADIMFVAIIFLMNSDLNFQIGYTTAPALIAVNTEYLICAITYFLLYHIIRKFRFKQTINKKALIFLLFPVSQIVLLSSILKILLLNPQNITIEIYIWLFVCVVVSVVSDIFSYRGLIQNSQLHETKLRNEHLEYERTTQYRYYEKINNMQHEIMKYRHDFKNALATAYALCDNTATAEEGKKMLDELTLRNEENKIPFFCANPIANTIIWDKSKVSQEKDIDFISDVSLGEELGIDSVDLCNLIVNALDNAIRGADKCSGNKKIEIKIKQENNRIFMIVSNSADMQDFESTDKLPSTKDKKNHGYGTEIIKSIVNKYNGDLVFSCKEKVFNVMLIIRSI